MQLNCKQGDLAIIVKSSCGNEGKIVRCLELLVTDKVPDIHGHTRYFRGGVRTVWRIDRPITFVSMLWSTQVEYCSDDKLRPLRGDINDEEIETSQELSTVV